MFLSSRRPVFPRGRPPRHQAGTQWACTTWVTHAPGVRRPARREQHGPTAIGGTRRRWPPPPRKAARPTTARVGSAGRLAVGIEPRPVDDAVHAIREASGGAWTVRLKREPERARARCDSWRQCGPLPRFASLTITGNGPGYDGRPQRQLWSQTARTHTQRHRLGLLGTGGERCSSSGTEHRTQSGDAGSTPASARDEGKLHPFFAGSAPVSHPAETRQQQGAPCPWVARPCGCCESRCDGGV